jgi:formylglycine-generating enzyme required for sulfatase activity
MVGGSEERKMKTKIRRWLSAMLAALAFTAVAHGQGCVGDIVPDNRVDGGDLGTLLANWGPVSSSLVSRACDLNGDGVINGADLGLLLSNWGACPMPSVPSWASLIEARPDPSVVTNSLLRAAISSTGLAWRVRDSRTGIEMLLIPPGTFQMGCTQSSSDFGCGSAETPVHLVTLTRPFYLGRYEVTQGQWQAKTGSNPSQFRGFADSPNRPVEMVSLAQIQLFLTSFGLRLPTEAEWEYACRAGTDTAFYNGSNYDSSLDALAWYSQNSGGQTHPVGTKQANGFGLYDMLGNVWEWLSDGWYLFDQAAVSDPSYAGNGYLSVRGGCWYRDSFYARSSYRGAVDPPGNPGECYGFRVARNP